MTLRIYAYTHNGKDSETWERTVGQTRTTGTGLIKVGQTTSRTARERIKQQLGTAYPNLDGVTILLDEKAARDDGSAFTDHHVHAALVTAGIKRPGGEWFEATLDEVKAAIHSVRTGSNFDATRTAKFAMRPEQQEAVDVTAAYFRKSRGDRPPKFLWNAKMRFGKTFTAYHLTREMSWTRLLVLTYKPAVQAAWRDDLLSHVDFAGWHFVDRDTPIEHADQLLDGAAPVVRFASFQDLNGKSPDGQVKAHNESIHLTDWDCIVIDEYHFGAWRDSARSLYDPSDSALADFEEPDEWVTEDDLGLNSRHYLYLSGTPFRAITNGEFTEDQVFNWTYVHEQRAKANWDPAGGENPYLELPAMEMYAYKIAPEAAEYAEDGEFSSFNLSEYFKAHKVDKSSRWTGAGAYVFEGRQRVREFLEMLRGKLTDQMKVQVLAGQKPPFPYEYPDFAPAVRHSVWYMADVASCFAMRDMLDEHPYFSGYEVVVAAGNGTGQGAAAKPPVEAAIGTATKKNKSGSITLSCGKLMTGVTVREWGAILMLRTLNAAESYFQAAFRVQSPWAHRDAEDNLTIHKPTCYVFEFDPNRALALVADYGTRLGRDDGVTPRESIGELLSYLPIFAFSGGEMHRLDTTEVLDWATVGIGATALAARWNSPLLVEVNEHTISAVLADHELMEALDQVEDFRALINLGDQVVTSTKMLKKAKREQGGQLDPAQREQQKETARLRKEIREKLQKFLAKIPVFMYVTDFREEALRHVIESLDSALFEKVTGLTIDDFKKLNRLRLFNEENLNAAIFQFRMFEQDSLHYADRDREVQPEGDVGLWDRTISGGEFSDAVPGHQRGANRELSAFEGRTTELLVPE
ncbi:GIY-YIG nuclease family protein [Micromonospora sp. CA-259024]|uniref:GIY-YIG nuclease family protein n=1 Tax=Micromonospora sp. CA-259024 TaxID=3239965 RepID=UPI003D92B9EA